MGFRRRQWRGRKIITLRFAGKCADCGAGLEVGAKARWYGRGRIYGIGCHNDNRTTTTRVQPEEGAMFDSMPVYGDLEERPSDDQEAIRFNVEVPGLGVKMKTGAAKIQTKLFD